VDSLVREALAPLGRALAAYSDGDRTASVVIHVAGFEPESIPASHFFRDGSEGDPIDRAALALARGRVLDVGACAGAHALPLVRAGHAVTALELIPEAVEVLRERGVEDARLGSVWSFASGALFDTVLALMNGTSLAGTAGRLDALLERIGGFVAGDGVLLIDSTAIEEDAEAELHYQLEFAGERGPPFPQLFVGEEELARAAARTGWTAEVVARDGARYLSRLVREDAAVP
jgi:SAM-dependent methyltransferase